MVYHLKPNFKTGHFCTEIVLESMPWSINVKVVRTISAWQLRDTYTLLSLPRFRCNTHVPFLTLLLKLITLLGEGHEHYGNLHGQHVSIWYRIKNERLRNFTDAKNLFQRNLIIWLQSFSLFCTYSNTLSDLHLWPNPEPTLWSKSGIVTGIIEDWILTLQNEVSK